MHEVRLDGRHMMTREDAHDILARKLDFPAYYGRNLDALADSLSEINVPMLITLSHADDMIEGLGAYGETLVSVLADAAQASPFLAFQMVTD